MLPFTQHLCDEHREIEKLLALLRSGLLVEDLREINAPEVLRLLSSLEFLVETVHHAKEELLLFPAMDQAGWLQGGPNCTLFMGLRIDWNPVGAIQALAKTQHPPIAPISHRPEVTGLFEKNSPLTIPIEEHEAGHQALQMILTEISALQSNRPVDPDRLYVLVRSYLTLMEFHIRKEEQCLFIGVDEQLSETRQRELLKQAQLDLE